MTNTAYKTRKLLSMLSCAEKENDGLMLTHHEYPEREMRVCDHRTVLLSADCR